MCESITCLSMCTYMYIIHVCVYTCTSFLYMSDLCRDLSFCFDNPAYQLDVLAVASSKVFFVPGVKKLT